MPLLTRIAKTNPSIAAIAVTIAEIKNRSLLITHNRRGARIDLRQHVSANGIELLIEFVAEHVGSLEGIPDFREIPLIKLSKQLCIHFRQAMAEVIYRDVYPVLDARQRGIVGGRAGILDYRNDKFTCGFRFLIDLGVFILEGL
jgi:hypothetical protein